MKKFALFCAAATIALPGTAWAQSTGTTDFEEDAAIVVTGTRQIDVAGVEVPDTSKARAALNSEFIQHQTPGQTVNDIINQLPGVSFQNNDPYGSAGGTMTIRGFDNTRISQTFDGVPLNDSGNYALYSNQQMDPELIEQVNVSLGSTDVDSPTAAASGSTVNYRTRLPFEEFHVRAQGSVGEYNFFRLFGVVDTGEITSWGTRAFLAASMAQNDNVYNSRGQIYKQQYNFRVYQPIGDNGDFVSLSTHYNQNRNNFFGSVPLRIDGAIGTPGAPPRRFPLTEDERFYTVARCTINTVARTGLQDLANTCGSTFDERYNPSNTGNIRLASRFTLADGLVLAVDPSFQFVKANGGGTVVGQEGRRDVNPASGTATPNQCMTAPNTAGRSCQTGYIGGIPYFGRDLNGDGDALDTVRVVAPSQTQTNRYGVIASLRYDLNDDHTMRVAYSFDRARHRQTGETGLLQTNGEPFEYFPIDDPLADVSGNILQKRDRLSYAILHQIGGEWRGQFMDDRLLVNAGVRAPFFTRDLNNFCATSSAQGFVECFGTNSAGLAAYQQFNPNVTTADGPQPLQGPQNRVLKYDAILPNVGFVFDLTPQLSTFANFSRGLQVPGTDNLYNSFFFAPDTPEAQPRPEKTDNYDVGLRYRSGGLLAQGSFWYTRFTDRLASSYDPELERNVYRNLGTVIKYGVDGSVAYQVLPAVQVYAYGSYLWSDIQDNIQIGGSGTIDCSGVTTPTTTCAVTAGRREAGAPVYTFGGRIQAQLGPVEVGVQAKRTGPRYVNDVNLPIVLAGLQVYPEKTPAYTLVDVDFRIPLEFVGLNDRSWFQINITNLFDEVYVGGFGGNLLNNTAPFVQIGAPRAISGTLVVGF
ncbi:TonB-dependent receptor [Allosphingosinicella sp.]|jgi:iron complex outermembrane receptor protein|uniref:TonB-dependent receptor n=1 Tax=Allosphingosinicella sp. TaxID=2823234 RepID=UPI002F1DD316